MCKPDDRLPTSKPRTSSLADGVEAAPEAVIADNPRTRANRRARQATATAAAAAAPPPLPQTASKGSRSDAAGHGAGWWAVASQTTDTAGRADCQYQRGWRTSSR